VARRGRRESGNQRKHENPNPIQRALIGRFHREVARLVDGVNPTTILELGCGEGYVLDFLSRAGVGADLTGVDLSAQAVEQARQRLGDRAEILQGDVADAVDGAARYGMVMILEVLEHLENPAAVLATAVELSDGPVLVSVPREPFFRGLNLARLRNIKRWGSDPDHVQHWTRRGFEDFLGGRFDVVDRGRAFPWTLLLLDSPPVSTSET